MLQPSLLIVKPCFASNASTVRCCREGPLHLLEAITKSRPAYGAQIDLALAP